MISKNYRWFYDVLRYSQHKDKGKLFLGAAYLFMSSSSFRAMKLPTVGNSRQ